MRGKKTLSGGTDSVSGLKMWKHRGDEPALFTVQAPITGNTKVITDYSKKEALLWGSLDFRYLYL